MRPQPRAFLSLFIAVLLVLFLSVASHAMAPITLVSQHYGSTSSDAGVACATDAAGDTYVTGYIGGAASFGGSTLTYAGGTDILLAKYDKNGAHVWSKSFGSSGADQGKAIAVDLGGNAYVTGSFMGTINLGGSPLVSAGGTDIFLVKYSSTGLHLWSYRYGSSGDDSGNGVVVDPFGNVIVTGTFDATVNFGGATSYGSGGLGDIFLVKYNSAGANVWTRTFGSTGIDSGYGIALDPLSNILLTGTFNGSIVFGPGALVSAGLGDIVLAKYDTAGVPVWSQRFGNAGDDAGTGVATDASGNVVLCGYSRLGLTIGTDTFSSSGDSDFLVAKFNAGGVYQWGKDLSTSGLDAAYAVATDPAGNVYATGTMGGTIQIGSTQHLWSGGRDIFLIKYDAAGKYGWSMMAGSASDDNGLGVAVDPSRYVHVTGYYSSGANVGSGGMPTVGGLDLFFADYSTGGALPQIDAVTDIANDQGRQVRIDFSRTGRDDAISASPVTQYEAYRRNDPAPAMAAVGAAPQALMTRPGVLTPEQLMTGGWTQVGSVAAHADDRYSINVPTIGDSTNALGQYLSVFYIRAATATPSLFYASAPDSGYSVDNLAPGIPGLLAYTAGSLTWKQSTAQDFDYFAVYGANSNSFGSATLVNYTIGTNMNVTASPYAYYFVTATDFSGNEGKPAIVNSLSGVGGTPASYVLSVTNYPNPFNPRTTVKYTVPSRGHVNVSVFDASGAHVATLFDGERSAGAYSVDWDGRAAGTSVAASGVYFVRIEQDGATRTKKMVLLK